MPTFNGLFFPFFTGGEEARVFIIEGQEVETSGNSNERHEFKGCTTPHGRAWFEASPRCGWQSASDRPLGSRFHCSGLPVRTHSSFMKHPYQTLTKMQAS